MGTDNPSAKFFDRIASGNPKKPISSGLTDVGLIFKIVSTIPDYWISISTSSFSDSNE